MAEERNVEEHAFDARAAKILREISKRSTRRGVLSSMGRLLLRITGVLILPLLPVDRMVPDAQAQSGCSLWYQCGMCGTLCTCCGGTLTQCPGSCPPSGGWAICCHNTSGQGLLVVYVDCCENGTACMACNGCQQCANNCTGAEWCGDRGRYTYRCTIAKISSVTC